MTDFSPLPDLPDVILVVPKRFKDSRGYFEESYVKDRYQNNGIDAEFVQDNHSLSVNKGVMRGLHFQTPPFAQAKLVRCVRGSILDVAVDIRVGSPTYGKSAGAVLSAENGHQLYVPVGFAHGFCTLEANCEVTYKVSDVYSKECDGGIAFDDSALGLEWPIPLDDMVVSEKDQQHPKLIEFNSPFKFEA